MAMGQQPGLMGRLGGYLGQVFSGPSVAEQMASYDAAQRAALAQGGVRGMMQDPALAQQGAELAGNFNFVGSVGKGGDALDLSTPARMARAAEQGFEEADYYKGMHPYDPSTGPVTNWRGEVISETPLRELTSIDRQGPFPAFGGADGDIPKIAGFLSNDPAVASRFAEPVEGAVYPLKYRPGRVHTIDAAGKKAGEVQFGPAGQPFRDAARSGEFDTIRIVNTADEGDITVALDPTNIRSRFAKFDPKKSNSADLLASVAAGGLMGTGMLGSER